MKFMTTGEAARRWGVSERMVQRYCAQGRVEGAERLSRSWRIPEGAMKPSDPRCDAGKLQKPARPRRVSGTHANLMPLMNAPFTPGHARAYAESLEEGMRRDVALAELAYFTGDAARAAHVAGAHLQATDAETRLSCCLICAYASLALGLIDEARDALSRARGALQAHRGKLSPQLSAAAAFVARSASVLLHLPEPQGLPSARETLPLLPPGLRLFSCYVQAHQLYLEGEYQTSLGIVMGAFAMTDELYPIPAIYLHLVAIMDLMSLRRPDDARRHLLAAWGIAHPDDLIEPFAEHHGLLGGMLEAAIKANWPDDFRRIIDITYRFSAGWRRVHNPATGDDVADNLTTTEFTAAMLAARGWTNAEIAEHMGVSPNTVKSFVSASMRKLSVKRRQDLTRYMLR